MTTITMPDGLETWLATGDRGTSSETIAWRLTGISFIAPRFGCSHPHDPADFYRCLKLLDAVPSFQNRLEELRDLSPVWARLVDAWDEIEAVFLREKNDGSGNQWKAPETYKLMRTAINVCDECGGSLKGAWTIEEGRQICRSCRATG